MSVEPELPSGTSCAQSLVPPSNVIMSEFSSIAFILASLFIDVVSTPDILDPPIPLFSASNFKLLAPVGCHVFPAVILSPKDENR